MPLSKFKDPDKFLFVCSELSVESRSKIKGIPPKAMQVTVNPYVYVKHPFKMMVLCLKVCFAHVEPLAGSEP